MKKTLIALALTALPVAAMADVTLYGQIKGGISAEQNRVKIGGDTAKYSLSGNSTDTVVRDFGSRIGFKGEEDLGNGLKTIWQVEQSVSLGGNTVGKDGKGSGWSNRETFIGLEGNFGKVRVGHLKNTFDDQAQIDPWEYKNNALGLGIFTRHDSRVDGASIKYDTPELAGFTGSLQYRTKANGTAAGKTYEDGDKFKGRDEAYLGLGYENSGFFGTYDFGYASKAYAKEDGSRKAGQLHRLQAGYDANNLFVAAAYQYGKGWENEENYLESVFADVKTGDVSTGGDALKTKEVALTAAYTMGAITPRISYAHGFDIKSATTGDKAKNTKYDQVVIGADYALSKRTTALVSAGWLRHNLGEYDVAGTDETVKASLTKKAFGVGLKHKF